MSSAERRSKELEHGKALSSDLGQANALFQSLKQQLDATTKNNKQPDSRLSGNKNSTKTDGRAWFDMGDTNPNRQSLLPITAMFVLH